MRRFWIALYLSLLWTVCFALALFAWLDPGQAQKSLSFTIPPIPTPITVTTTLDNLNDNGDCTLREAIQAANLDMAVDACPAGSGMDLILLSPGSYVLSMAALNEEWNGAGDLDIRSDLVIKGAGSAVTFIDANHIDRVLHIPVTATVEIRGITVQNGQAADGAHSGCGESGTFGCPGEKGGGIFNSGTTKLVDVIVQHNRSGDGGEGADWHTGDGGDGGGIFNEGRLELYTSQVVGNRAGDGTATMTPGGYGGGISNVGILIADGLIISGNQTGWGGWVPKGYGHTGGGGGISNQGTLTVTNGQILANSAGNGGGVYNTGTASFSVSAIGHNTGSALVRGGGIHNQGELFMDRCALYENVVGARGTGGGLFNYGLALLTNCTISDNRSGQGDWYYTSFPGGDGGGIHNSGAIALYNSTIARNQTRAGDCTDGPCLPGGSGGGIANDDGTVIIYNSIVAQNGVAFGGVGPDCTGVVNSQGANFVGSTQACTVLGTSDDILNRYAWLGPLRDNGGPTPTSALLPQSLALDAGNCMDGSGLPIATDQRGESRPQGSTCDLGAFESALSFMPPYIVYLTSVGNSSPVVLR